MALDRLGRAAHDAPMTARVAPLCVALTLLTLVHPRAQEPSLADVLSNAAAYVAEFEQQLSAIVAEETYLQLARNGLQRSGLSAPSRPTFERRALKSDLLLVRPENATGWVQFRDVFEVDGKPVRDRDERLTQLFLDPSDAAGNQFARIIKESARYNIGEIQRTINLPVLPLMMLEQENQRRFRFKRLDDPAKPTARERERDIPDSPNFVVSTEVWVISYEETRKPTLIQLAGGGDITSKGRFWIEPLTGQVLMGELITENADLRAQINVSYQSEPLLGLFVPVEMRERYSSNRRSTTIEGTATYGRFRRFEVKTDEELVPVR
jgi:hypothetical protein